MIHITAHACQRYVERVEPAMSLAEAAAEIRSHTPALECAAEFRCGTVRLGNGALLKLDGYCVVTVLARRTGRGRNLQIAMEAARS